MSVREREEVPVQLHPNPANESARIVVNDTEHRIFQLDIITVDGRLGLRDRAFQNGAQVDLRWLSAGAYVARLTDADGGVHQVHFVKQ
jgi:hypothetical protein